MGKDTRDSTGAHKTHEIHFYTMIFRIFFIILWNIFNKNIESKTKLGKNAPQISGCWTQANFLQLQGVPKKMKHSDF